MAQKEKLPNGQPISIRTVAEYLLALPHNYTYYPYRSKVKKRYTLSGIKSLCARVLGSSAKSFVNSVDISTFEMVLSDEFQMEEGEDEGLMPFEIQGGDYRLGICNDIHIPFHDLSAIKIAIRHFQQSQVNKILINGDLLDFHGLSRFHKNPTKIFIHKEIELARHFFQQLRKLFPSEQIIYKYGNHDSRLSNYIYEKAPALYGLDALNLSELLNLRDLGVHTVAPEQIVRAGKLNIIHGHEFPSGPGAVNVARSIRLRAGDNIAMGHFHRTQTDVATTIGDKTHGSYAVGCLCGMRPKWYPMAYTTWNHGFATVDVGTDGTYQFNNYKIVGGKVV